jgi:ParB family chromosome partitioning protein
MTQPKRGLGRGLDALFGGAAAPAAQPEAQNSDPEQGGDVSRAASVPPPPSRETPPPSPTPITRREPEPEREPEPAYERRPPPATPVATVSPPPSRRGPEVLDIDLISPNPEQPRTNFEPEKLRELSESIREHGVIQPLIVSRDEDGGYFLIAGERRLQAARLAGLEIVPVVVRQAESSALLELALIENIQRADLNAVEEAMAYRRLVEEYNLTQEEVAKRVGKNRATVANALRLLQLESEIRRSLVAGEISEGHARALLGLPEGRGRVNAWREVVKRKLSVRDTEGFVRRSLAETPASSSSAGAQTARRDSAYSDIESRLRRALSTRVKVEPQKKGAKIVIECYSTEEFENVVSTLLGEYQ